MKKKATKKPDALARRVADLEAQVEALKGELRMMRDPAPDEIEVRTEGDTIDVFCMRSANGVSEYRSYEFDRKGRPQWFYEDIKTNGRETHHRTWMRFWPWTQPSFPAPEWALRKLAEELARDRVGRKQAK